MRVIDWFIVFILVAGILSATGLISIAVWLVNHV